MQFYTRHAAIIAQQIAATTSTVTPTVTLTVVLTIFLILYTCDAVVIAPEFDSIITTIIQGKLCLCMSLCVIYTSYFCFTIFIHHVQLLSYDKLKQQHQQ